MLHNVDPITTEFFNRALDCNTCGMNDEIETCRIYLDPEHKEYRNADYLNALSDDEADAYRLNHAAVAYALHIRYVQALFNPLTKEQLADLYEKIKLVMPYIEKTTQSFDTDISCGMASPWSYNLNDSAEIALLYATFSLETDEASADPDDPDTRDEVGKLINHAVAVLNMTAERARGVITNHLFDDEEEE